MNENIKAFVKKVAEDKELQAQLSSLKTPEEAYEVARSVQPGITKEDFMQFADKMKDAINTFNELTDEDLAKVAGGAGTTMILTVAVGSISVSIATVVGAIAAV